MNASLDHLIERIRQEGIEEAERTAAELVEKAKQEASVIVAQAKEQAEKIKADAQAQADRFEENGKRALQQAARDVELVLKERIMDLFDRVFRRQVGEAMRPEAMDAMIRGLIADWAKKGGAAIAVSKTDKDKLEALLFANLKGDLKKGITLQVSPTITRGFRIELKGENIYYDFADESVSDALMAFISPHLQSILDGRDG